MEIQCSTLEHYDIKAPLTAYLHQALEIFALKKESAWVYDRSCISSDQMNPKVKGDFCILLWHYKMVKVNGHTPCLLMVFTDVMMFSENCK